MARIAMIVSNPCNPDYRVIKQAESLVRHGHKVRIFCTAKSGIAQEETINGVEYQRVWLTPPVKPRTQPALVASIAQPTKEAASRPAGLPSLGSTAPTPEGLATDDSRTPLLLTRTLERAVMRPLARATKLARDLQRRSTAAVRKTATRTARHLHRMRGTIVKTGARLHKSAKSPFARLLKAPFVTKRTKFRTTARIFAPLVGAWKPDVVHAHDLICLPAGRAAAAATGARLVYDSHELEVHRNPPLPYFLKRHYRSVEARHIRMADAVITVCEPIADHLAREYRISRPAVVYNAPTVALPSAAQPGRARARGWKDQDGAARDIREESGVPPGGLLGIYVGLVTINRGIETMIDALDSLPNVWFAAVGPRNEAVAKALIGRAAQRGIAERFSILPPVHPDSVVDFIGGADFGINPLKPVTLSYNYAMPNKIFEMSLAGLAIVNSDAQETARFVREHGIGVVFDHREPSDCARAVHELTADIDAYRPSAAKLIAMRDRFGWHRQEETLIALYDRLLAARAEASDSPRSTRGQRMRA